MYVSQTWKGYKLHNHACVTFSVLVNFVGSDHTLFYCKFVFRCNFAIFSREFFEQLRFYWDKLCKKSEEADMENVQNFTRAGLFVSRFYPKVRKLR